MTKKCYEKFLVFIPLGNSGYDGFLLESSLKKVPLLRYWCYSEHITPIGVSVLYVYLCFYRRISFEELLEHGIFLNGTVDCLLDLKPSRLYRKYIKETGFRWNLGKTRPIPGTFNEKEGGV